MKFHIFMITVHVCFVYWEWNCVNGSLDNSCTYIIYLQECRALGTHWIRNISCEVHVHQIHVILPDLQVV